MDNNLNAGAPGYALQTIALSGMGTQATPAIACAPSPVQYGTPLTAAMLGCTATVNGATVAGTFVPNPPAGTILTAGTQTVTVTFTPTDTTDYTTATANVPLTVTQATPAITWPMPAAITYGTALTGAQLDASSTVSGTFT